MAQSNGSSLMSLVTELQDRKRFQELNWTGRFENYLEIVNDNPRVARNAFQRIYDMIIAYGSDEFIDANPTLLDRGIMLTHYSAEVLFSEEARRRFVAPDLDGIPG